MIKKKYNNKLTKCIARHIHDSKFEAEYCDSLWFKVYRKDILSFEIQKKFKLLVCDHYVDFYVERLDGVFEVHEVKGCKTAVWQLKRKLFKYLYPDIRYIVISKLKGRSLYGKKYPKRKR